MKLVGFLLQTDATNLPEHRDFIDDVVPQPVFFSTTRIAAAPAPFALASQASNDFAEESFFQTRFKEGPAGKDNQFLE